MSLCLCLCICVLGRIDGRVGIYMCLVCLCLVYWVGVSSFIPLSGWGARVWCDRGDLAHGTPPGEGDD